MLRNKKTFINKYITPAVAVLCAGAMFFSQGFQVHASTKEERIAAHRVMPVESNQTENWPEGPVVSAEAAILYVCAALETPLHF